MILAFSRIRQVNRSLTREIVAGERWFDKDGHWRCFTDANRLGGHDLHPSSKACAELAIAAYNVFFWPMRVFSWPLLEHGMSLVAATGRGTASCLIAPVRWRMVESYPYGYSTRFDRGAMF